MPIKIVPVTVSNVSSETWRESQRPTDTPNNVVQTNADPAPKNTTQGACDSALINRVVTWVLSPNSATKMVRKVVKKS